MNDVIGYVLKADIRHYFETVDHEILMEILGRRIKDKELFDLIRLILSNHKTEIPGKGMPLGNLTSQFFANVYLSELDYFVKHELRAKYYIRYVDDFVILHTNARLLEEYMRRISSFLREKLMIELHPEKSHIIPLRSGITLLGFRVFYYFKLLKKSNQKRVDKRFLKFRKKLERGEITPKRVICSFMGWQGYAKMCNSYKLRLEVRRKIIRLLSELNDNPN